jgi:HEPN domain-containing protein
MANRSKDWLRQAERDLSHARNALQDNDFEWSCFATQQAAENAVKAVYEHLHGEGWGHVVSKLLRELPDQSGVTQTLLETAMRLDRLYILPRYPNGFESGAPRGLLYPK